MNCHPDIQHFPSLSRIFGQHSDFQLRNQYTSCVHQEGPKPAGVNTKNNYGNKEKVKSSGLWTTLEEEAVARGVGSID